MGAAEGAEQRKVVSTQVQGQDLICRNVFERMYCAPLLCHCFSSSIFVDLKHMDMQCPMLTLPLQQVDLFMEAESHKKRLFLLKPTFFTFLAHANA